MQILAQFKDSVYEMGFIEVLIMILGLYSVLPRIYYFIEVL